MAADGVNAAGGVTGVGGSYGHQIFGQKSGDDFTNSIFLKEDKNANVVGSNGGRSSFIGAIRKVVDFAQSIPQRLSDNSGTEEQDPDIITKLEGTVASSNTQNNSSAT